MMADVLVLRKKASPLLWNQVGNLANAGEIRKKYIASLKKADYGDYADLISFSTPSP